MKSKVYIYTIHMANSAKTFVCGVLFFCPEKNPDQIGPGFFDQRPNRRGLASNTAAFSCQCLSTSTGLTGHHPDVEKRVNLGDEKIWGVNDKKVT